MGGTDGSTSSSAKRRRPRSLSPPPQQPQPSSYVDGSSLYPHPRLPPPPQLHHHRDAAATLPPRPSAAASSSSSPTAPRTRTHCIVGTGFSGLCAVRALLEEGVPSSHIEIFEQRDYVGGQWGCESREEGANNPITRACYLSNAVGDVPPFRLEPRPTEEDPSGLRSSFREVSGYLMMLWQRSGLLDRVHLGCRVALVSPLVSSTLTPAAAAAAAGCSNFSLEGAAGAPPPNDREGRSGYKVCWRDAHGRSGSALFDTVVLALGRQRSSTWRDADGGGAAAPLWSGADSFPGKLMSIREYYDHPWLTDTFSSQRILLADDQCLCCEDRSTSSGSHHHAHNDIHHSSSRGSVADIASEIAHSQIVHHHQQHKKASSSATRQCLPLGTSEGMRLVVASVNHSAKCSAVSTRLDFLRGIAQSTGKKAAVGRKNLFGGNAVHQNPYESVATASSSVRSTTTESEDDEGYEIQRSRRGMDSRQHILALLQAEDEANANKAESDGEQMATDDESPSHFGSSVPPRGGEPEAAAAAAAAVDWKVAEISSIFPDGRVLFTNGQVDGPFDVIIGGPATSRCRKKVPGLDLLPDAIRDLIQPYPQEHEEHLDLYRTTFHPCLPGVAFLMMGRMRRGCCCSVPAVADVQARYAAKVLTHHIELPSPARMEMEMKECRGAWCRNTSDRASFAASWHGLADSWANDMGCLPNWENYPDLAHFFLMGPFVAAQYRLETSNPHERERALSLCRLMAASSGFGRDHEALRGALPIIEDAARALESQRPPLSAPKGLVKACSLNRRETWAPSEPLTTPGYRAPPYMPRAASCYQTI